jgi:hypothetical protein
MVRCNAMAWTEEEKERKVLLTGEGAQGAPDACRPGPVADTTVVTEEEAMPRLPLTGTGAESASRHGSASGAGGCLIRIGTSCCASV